MGKRVGRPFKLYRLFASGAAAENAHPRTAAGAATGLPRSKESSRAVAGAAAAGAMARRANGTGCG